MDTEKLRENMLKIGCGKCCDWGGDASGCLGVEDECMWPAEVDAILHFLKEYLLEKARVWEDAKNRSTICDAKAYLLKDIANSLTPDTVCPQCNPGHGTVSQ